MLREVARKAVGAVAPAWLGRYDLRKAFAREGEAFRDRLTACPTLEAKVDAALAEPRFPSIQKRAEILGLLARVRSLAPARVCEIGSFSGGTLALFAQVAAPDARLLSLDLEYRNERGAGFRRFALPQQEIRLIQGDSHQPATKAKVTDWLAGQPLDFLFIDGDHSFEGVADDFARYAPLVRQGGLVAFHDILPDRRTRGEPATLNDVGEVPLFWEGVKAKGYDAEELIENRDQDGMGIGLVRWDGKVR